MEEHASRFAQALGMSAGEQLTLERGVLVRDIGKLRIPNEVHLKQQVLTHEGWAHLQKHPELGGELVEKFEPLADTADIVRHRHECFYGSGYPAELSGDDIPLAAHIAKLLDVYCATTSPRHYRKGQSTHEAAIDYLKSESDKQFDPELLKVFVDAEIGQPLDEFDRTSSE